MKDLTESCIDDLQKQLQKEVSRVELRSLYCFRCKNSTCPEAQAQETDWESRIRTQEDRLLTNPNIEDGSSSRWDDVRAIDFPDVLQEVLTIAANQDSWDVEDLSGKPKVEKTSHNAVEEAVKALRITQGKEPIEEEPTRVVEEQTPGPPDDTYVVEIPSKSKKGVVYSVRMRDGVAIGCDCGAGVHGKKCVHLKWAEDLEVAETFSATEEETSALDPVVQSVESPTIAEPTKRARPRKDGFLPPEFPRYTNTIQPPHGHMLGGEREPAPQIPDPWEPNEQSNVTTVKTGGLTVTLGKKK